MIKQKIRPVLVIAAALLFAVSVPVFADHGTGGADNGGGAGNSVSADASQSDSGTPSDSSQKSDSVAVVEQNKESQAKTETEVQTESQKGQDQAELHAEGDNLVSQLGKEHKAKSPSDLQKVCTAHKQGLTTK